jgi:hypothetical protein
VYFAGGNIMDVSFLKESAERCRSLAEKADEFTKRRLLDLAAKYEHRIAKPSPATRMLRARAGLTDAP